MGASAALRVIETGGETMGKDEKRNLTDADVKAIAREFKTQFYTNLGQGVFALVWKAIILAAVAIAGYGALKGMR